MKLLLLVSIVAFHAHNCFGKKPDDYYDKLSYKPSHSAYGHKHGFESKGHGYSHGDGHKSYGHVDSYKPDIQYVHSEPQSYKENKYESYKKPDYDQEDSDPHSYTVIHDPDSYSSNEKDDRTGHSFFGHHGHHFFGGYPYHRPHFYRRFSHGPHFYRGFAHHGPFYGGYSHRFGHSFDGSDNSDGSDHSAVHDETESRSKLQQSFSKINQAINRFVEASRDAVEEISDSFTTKLSSSVPAITTITTDLVEGAAGLADASLGLVADLTAAKSEEANAVEEAKSEEANAVKEEVLDAADSVTNTLDMDEM